MLIWRSESRVTVVFRPPALGISGAAGNGRRQPPQFLSAAWVLVGLVVLLPGLVAGPGVLAFRNLLQAPWITACEKAGNNQYVGPELQ